MVVDCCEYSPDATPGRTYTLTHLHLGCLFHTGVTAAQFSAWVTQAPNLRHYGATYYQDEDEGIRLLETATNSHLQTLDLTGAPALPEDLFDPYSEGREALNQAVRGLPENLRLAPFGFDEVGELVGEILLECSEDCNREDLRIEQPEGRGVGPKLWDWREAVAPLCYAPLYETTDAPIGGASASEADTAPRHPAGLRRAAAVAGAVAEAQGAHDGSRDPFRELGNLRDAEIRPCRTARAGRAL